MNPQVIASTVVGLFLALAAYMEGKHEAIIMLAICAMFAYASHELSLPLSVRIACHYIGIALGLIVAGYVALNS